MTEREIDELGPAASAPDTEAHDEANADQSAPGAPATDAPAAEGPAADPLQRERDELLDRLLRKTAEFDNYRKRVDRERREQTEWAAADVLTDVLAIVDDFERALAADLPPEAEAWKAGVELIHRQLQDLLRKRGLIPIDAVGADFDPHVHQAVAYEETPGAREGEIVGELRRGYRLGERLLRPSMVKVAKAS